MKMSNITLIKRHGPSSNRLRLEIKGNDRFYAIRQSLGWKLVDNQTLDISPVVFTEDEVREELARLVDSRA